MNLIKRLFTSILASSLLLSSSSSYVKASDREVRIYSGRHYNTDKQIYKKFNEETGIKVRLIEATGISLVERLKREGAKSKADVILLPHIGASTMQAEENCAVMAVDQLKDFLVNGNIKNSVNFPNVSLPRSTEKRITITNKNVPAMIGKIATKIGNIGLNIADMSNVSRGEIAYNIIDIEDQIDEKSLNKLREIEDVINVRLLN